MAAGGISGLFFGLGGTAVNAANNVTTLPMVEQTTEPTTPPMVEQGSRNALDGQSKSNYDVQKEVDLNGREEAYEWKNEDRHSFLERVHEGTRTSGEVGAIAYAYDPVGPFDTSRSAEETAQELTALGIKSFYHNGLEWNDGRKTFIDRGDAATIGTEIVGISRKAFGDGKEIAGHEALHNWYFTDAGKSFVSEFKANWLMDTPYAIEQALKVMDDYFQDGNISDKALFAEELIARIGGQIHSGKYDNNLRTMFRDFGAVKRAWQSLVHENAPNYQFAAQQSAAMPAEGNPTLTMGVDPNAKFLPGSELDNAQRGTQRTAEELPMVDGYGRNTVGAAQAQFPYQEAKTQSVADRMFTEQEMQNHDLESKHQVYSNAQSRADAELMLDTDYEGDLHRLCQGQPDGEGKKHPRDEYAVQTVHDHAKSGQQ